MSLAQATKGDMPYQVRSLYRSLLRQSSQFAAYNFREYAKRRTRDSFRENQSVTEERRIQELMQKGLKELQMLKFRNRDRSNRSGRGPIEHNVLEGLPINQYREVEITIGPNSADNKPVDKDAWPELPMPRDSHMLPEHSQQLLRAARSGKIYKPPAPPEDDNEMKDEEEENKEVQTGFTVKKYAKVARHLEAPEPEYLAKRRKGLPSPYVNGQLAQPALRETKVKKLDAEGNVAVYKVLVPEGQAVEGEVQPTDAAIEVAPATAAPGTIVEGVGVVNAEGVVVANDILQQTPPRRRPPPPKKKRGGPGRGKKKVVFAEGATEQGTPTSNTGSDLPTISGLKQEDGSVAPSDGGDTPMADAGGEDEEGSGEEGSEDEDHDMERTSTPVTPSQPTSAPTSVPEQSTDMPDITPSEEVAAQGPPEDESVEAPETLAENKASAQSAFMPETTELGLGRDDSSSPDLPLSTISHSRQNSLNQIPTSVTTTEPIIVEPAPSETTIPAIISEPEPVLQPVPEPEPLIAPEQVAEPAPVVAPEPVIEPMPLAVSEPIAEPVIEPVAEPVAEPEPEPVPVAASEPEVIQAPPAVPSAPPSEPDLLGSLERQLEKDSEDMSAN
ncbi:Nn.00g035340.m01.CDS01 [Neocucurbitaria sp. VM-36]